MFAIFASLASDLSEGTRCTFFKKSIKQQSFWSYRGPVEDVDGQIEKPLLYFHDNAFCLGCPSQGFYLKFLSPKSNNFKFILDHSYRNKA